MDNLLLAFYADDFTGATDAMEALSRGGAPTTLVLDPGALNRTTLPPRVRCVGVAGTTRSLPAASIEAELATPLRLLASLEPVLLQYKVCSTFDSSPALGSIGGAIETALASVARGAVPLVVGVPRLGRYCVFGNLFARAGSSDPDVYRLDRHPVMSRHPQTPMLEADLRQVLAEQTDVPVTLRSLTDPGEPGFAGPPGPAHVVLCDVLDEAGLDRLGQAIWTGATQGAVRFAVGSSGLDYALIAEWQRLGLIAPPPVPSPLPPADQVLVVSASCSAVTAEQLRCAIAAGFAGLGIDGPRLSARPGPELRRLASAAREELAKGRSVALHTFPGAFGESRPAPGFPSSAELGALLGAVIDDLLPDLPGRRVIVCGGDTSSHVGRALGIERLDFMAPIDPGAPLCLATRQRGPATFEIAFKGGQMGRSDYLIRALGHDGPGTADHPSGVTANTASSA